MKNYISAQEPSEAVATASISNSSPIDQNGSGKTVKNQGECHFFSQLAMCTTIAEFKDSVATIVRQLGFTDFSFSVLHTPPAKSLSTLPDSVREFHLKNDFGNYDFFLEHAEGSSTPMFLSAMESFITNSPFASERIYRNANYYKLLASLGYHDCYSIPHSFGLNTRRAAFLFFAKDLNREEFQRTVEQCQSLLPMIVGAVTYFGSSHFPEHFLDAKFNGQVAMTPKPLKMLEAVAKEGLQLKDAARKLSISLDTANKHVAAAKQALGATTLANAVYLAMTHGLIQQDEKE